MSTLLNLACCLVVMMLGNWRQRLVLLVRIVHSACHRWLRCRLFIVCHCCRLRSRDFRRLLHGFWRDFFVRNVNITQSRIIWNCSTHPWRDIDCNSVECETRKDARWLPVLNQSVNWQLNHDSKNCANLFLSELRQISTNFYNFWQKDGKEAIIMRLERISWRYGGNNDCRALKASSPTLNWILCLMGSEWRKRVTSVTLSDQEALVTVLDTLQLI